MKFNFENKPFYKDPILRAYNKEMEFLKDQKNFRARIKLEEFGKILGIEQDKSKTPV